jgi:hypothetical protein
LSPDGAPPLTRPSSRLLPLDPFADFDPASFHIPGERYVPVQRVFGCAICHMGSPRDQQETVGDGDSFQNGGQLGAAI